MSQFGIGEKTILQAKRKCLYQIYQIIPSTHTQQNKSGVTKFKPFRWEVCYFDKEQEHWTRKIFYSSKLAREFYSSIKNR